MPETNQILRIFLSGRFLLPRYQISRFSSHMPLTAEIPNSCGVRLDLISSPVIRKIITTIGSLQETDLDDKRFDVRGIEAGSVTDLRCIYGPKVADPIASKWLNHKVEVTGRVERDASGRARLMKVAHMELVDAPDNAQQQIKFDFPDENT